VISRLVILAIAIAGCTPNTDNLQLGSGDVSLTTTSLGGDRQHWSVAAAWAQPYLATTFGAGGSLTDGFGGFAIKFSGETTSPTPATCRESLLLTTNAPELDLQTQSKGTASVGTGDVPFMTATNSGTIFDTHETYASFDFSQPLFIDAGHVTITAADDEHIAGTFDASGLESYWSEADQAGGDWSEQIVGYFDVPICWNE